MNITQITGDKQEDVLVNIEALQKVANGYIRFLDGSQISVADTFESIRETILKSQQGK